MSGTADDTIVKEITVEKPDPGTNAVRLVSVDRKLSRLEYLVRKEVITPRQYTAGAWLAERWAAYFTPGVSSGIEDHAPGSIPSDPLARWVRGQRTMDTKGRPRTPPPTFRPRKPSELRRGHDGWSVARCDALQNWVRASRLLERLSAYERQVVMLVAVEGLSPEGAVTRMRGLTRRPPGRQLKQCIIALCRGLEILAEEVEPSIQRIAA